MGQTCSYYTKIMAQIENLGDTCANVSSCAAFQKYLQIKEEDEDEKVFELRLDFVLEFDKAPKLPNEEIASKYFQKTQGLPLSNTSLRSDLVEQNGDLQLYLTRLKLMLWTPCKSITRLGLSLMSRIKVEQLFWTDFIPKHFGIFAQLFFKQPKNDLYM